MYLYKWYIYSQSADKYFPLIGIISALVKVCVYMQTRNNDITIRINIPFHKKGIEGIYLLTRLWESMLMTSFKSRFLVVIF